MFNRKADPTPLDTRNAHAPAHRATAQPPGNNDAHQDGLSDFSSVAEAPDTGTSVIGSNFSIEGQSITIRCQGSLHVNGNIQADLHCQELVVGDAAVITGAITADKVDIHGQVGGAVRGQHVTLHSSSEVEGDIHSQFLAIEPGASFDGRSRKVKNVEEVTPQLTNVNEAAHAAGQHGHQHHQNSSASIVVPTQQEQSGPQSYSAPLNQ